MGTVWQDLKYAIRALRKNLLFTLAAIFTLALGIAANTAIFSMINAVLLNPLPIKALKDPERLVMIWERNPALSALFAERIPPCLKNYRIWKKENRSLEGIALYREESLNITVQGDDGGRRPEQVLTARSSVDFFPLLGVRPRLGRNFTTDEMQPGKERVAIISDDLYRSRFQSDPRILGKPLRFDGFDYEIVGVLPPDFALPAMGEGFDRKKPKVWVPLPVDLAKQDERSYFAYGRLKRGVNLEQARAEMKVIGKRLETADPDLNTGFSINVFSVKEEDVSPSIRRSLFMLQVAVAFVLLIACANVANLLLARAVGREKEIAIRVALGAGRLRIVRQVMSESLLLSGIGGAAGLLLSFWALQILPRLGPEDLHGFHELRIDPLVLSFTMLVTMLAGLLFGLAPAFHALGLSINQALNRGARSVGGTSNRVRGALVIFEIALSLILLIGAGLTIRSLAHLMATDLGFHPEHLLTLRIALPALKYSTPEQRAAFGDRLLDAVRQQPGVRSAGLTNGVPMQSINEGSYEIEGAAAKPGHLLVADYARVSDAYFETLGVKLVRGRTFDRTEVRSKQPAVAVVNETFVRQNWPGTNAIGKVILFGGEQGGTARFSVIGIVGDEHQFGPEEASHPEIYLPGHHLKDMILLVRTAGEPLSLASNVERQVWNVDKDQPVSDVKSMEGVLREWVAPRRFSMTVLLNFAGAALLLAAVGLYSVLAYSVTLRTKEIGIRVALGADPRSVAVFVMRQALQWTVTGVAIGIAGALMLTRFMQSLLFGINAADPSTFVSVALLLIVVAAVASYLPARRASHINPLEALRVE